MAEINNKLFFDDQEAVNLIQNYQEIYEKISSMDCDTQFNKINDEFNNLNNSYQELINSNNSNLHLSSSKYNNNWFEKNGIDGAFKEVQKGKENILENINEFVNSINEESKDLEATDESLLGRFIHYLDNVLTGVVGGLVPSAKAEGSFEKLREAVNYYKNNRYGKVEKADKDFFANLFGAGAVDESTVNVYNPKNNVSYSYNYKTFQLTATDENNHKIITQKVEFYVPISIKNNSSSVTSSVLYFTDFTFLLAGKSEKSIEYAGNTQIFSLEDIFSDSIMVNIIKDGNEYSTENLVKTIEFAEQWRCNETFSDEGDRGINKFVMYSLSTRKSGSVININSDLIQEMLFIDGYSKELNYSNTSGKNIAYLYTDDTLDEYNIFWKNFEKNALENNVNYKKRYIGRSHNPKSIFSKDTQNNLLQYYCEYGFDGL